MSSGPANGTRRRLTGILAVLLAVLLIAAGVAETTRAVVSGDGGIVFWFGALVGGGCLVLLGRFALRGRPGASFCAVATGCLLGALATAWTLVVPVLALVVIVLTAMETGGDADRTRG